ncbi:MAG: site-2 protease family protein [Deltaproteobacteria bacterium]|nr:site-2 protease family protein [Deltaproteobacteria bacterium]
MGGKGSLTVARIRGIPIRLHFTFLIILPYLAYILAKTSPSLARMAGVRPDALLLPPLALGALLGVGLFVCVLIHELAHVFVGLRGGAKVQGVTLMLVGGVSEVTEFPARPSFEAAMAVAGPLASLGLAALCLAGFHLAGAGVADLRFSLYYLSFMNFALAIFNLIPAFPMDGGRILRAVLAMLTNRVRATRIASWVGQGLAIVFLLAGLYSLNWVLILIGVLVVAGARAEFEMVKSGSVMEGLTVASAMLRFPPTVEAGDSLASVLARMERELKTTYFVLEHGALVGAVSAEDARRSASSPSFARAADVMRREVPTLSPEQDLASASRTLRTSGMTILPVTQAGALVGSVSFSTVAAAVRAREAARAVEPKAPREREAT